MYVNEPFEPKTFEHYIQDPSLLKTLKHPICLVGMPDQTNLGRNCAEYLIQELKAEKVVIFNFNDFGPSISVEEQDRIVTLAKIEVYVVKKYHEIADLIIVMGNGVPISNIGIHFLSDKIAEFLSSLKPRLIISFASFPISYPTPTPKTYLAHTSEELLHLFKINKKTHTNEDLGLQLLKKGIVLGMNGLIISYAKALYDTIGGILLSETVIQEKIDPHAVKAILEVINAVFNLNLSLASLRLDTKEYFKKVTPEPLSEDDLLKKARKRIKS
ncbi:MAG: PAC2 family protein [Candidatus Helarchaeota archaeon]|nr:PAC2 family protein [Candidatus Helarchaeota archaeon]